MATKKISKPHSSGAKKTAAKTAKSARAKKIASKRSPSAAKSKKSKKSTERPAWLKKRDELTLRAFQMTYESYQRGEFERL
jgi:hypothetical protein